MPQERTEAQIKGDALEKRVERLYNKLGKWNVKRNLILWDKYGNKSQIDVTYGYFFKKYIECKNYSSGHLVPLDDVAKFKSVLELNNIPVSSGIFITTSTYVPRARTIGIKTIDGKQLKTLERTAWFRNISSKLLFCSAAIGTIGYAYYSFSDDKRKRELKREYERTKKEFFTWTKSIRKELEKWKFW